MARRLVSIKQIPILYPGAFTEASIRWLIFNEKQNGFFCCSRKIRRGKVKWRRKRNREL